LKVTEVGSLAEAIEKLALHAPGRG
jgi:hypothetical protein